MIKVVDVPKKKEPEIMHYRVECMCGCVFECDSTDWKEQIVGHGETDDVLRCPHCMRKIYKRPAWNGIGARIKYI